jgi:hypothetical protein
VVRPFSRFIRLSLVASLGVFLTACAEPPPYSLAQRTGMMTTPVNESSGLAASRRDAKMLWTHNDSRGEPVLYALEPNGAQRGRLHLVGVSNSDWEDLASFELDGRAWLLIADVGDNASRRTDCALYVIAEPDPSELSPVRDASASLAWKIPVRFPDGPRDCEAVAVDARAGLVYLLAKRTSPHGLYAIPLRPTADGTAPVATLIAEVPNALIPQPSTSQRMLPIASGRYRAQPTGMDFSTDGSAAVVVTYGDVLLFRRQRNESWKTAFTRAPVVLDPHHLLQAEGVAFGSDNRTIYVSSEGEGSNILRYKPAK